MYYGQCSELCGKDHGFMPIAIKIVSQDEYNTWLTNQLGGATLTTPQPQNVKN